MASRGRRLLVWGALVLALGAGWFATRGPAPPLANPPGTFVFAALGDGPYGPLEALRYRLVLQELEANDLSFVVHVGDIFWRPCSEARYRQTRAEFDALRHPVIYTPGDNEWADCWEPLSGPYLPLDRLAALRGVFHAQPQRSLGRRPLVLVSQATEPASAFRGYPENQRWSHRGLVFATVHLVGSDNAGRAFPRRSAADDAATIERTAAATEWMRATFAAASADGASAIVIAFHASPRFERELDDEYRQPYEPFLSALADEAERYARPVLVIHGDDHEFIVDQPFASRPAGAVGNLTRLEVPGSPDIGWVRVTVTPGAAVPFAFAQQVVPRWKHW